MGDYAAWVSAISDLIMTITTIVAVYFAWREYKKHCQSEVVELVNDYRKACLSSAKNMLFCGAKFWAMCPIFAEEKDADNDRYVQIHESIEYARAEMRLLSSYMDAIDNLLHGGAEDVSKHYMDFSEKKNDILSCADSLISSLFVSYFIFSDKENKYEDEDEWRNLVLSEAGSGDERNCYLISAMNQVLLKNDMRDSLNLSDSLYIACSKKFIDQILYLSLPFYII